MKTSLRRIGAVGLVLVLAAILKPPILGVAAQDEATPSPPSPPPPVSVSPALSARFAPMLWAPGSVMSREDARVASEQEGRITVVAEVGDKVSRGDLLARLDDSLLRLQERHDATEVARIEAQLEFARAQEHRLSQLVDKASIAGSQLDEARSQRRVLEQELERAGVALERARLRLADAAVRAPFDGIVAERYIQVGEFIATGAPVLRLVNTDALEVRARAPVQLAAQLAPGTEVVLRAAGTERSGAVRAVVPVGDESSRQFEVRVALSGAPWVIGAALEVGLPSAAPRSVVAVPRDALLLRPDQTFVVRVARDDTIERIAVRIGAAQGDLVEIEGDIAVGDRIVVRGAERISPGQRVRVEHEPAPSAEIAAG